MPQTLTDGLKQNKDSDVLQSPSELARAGGYGMNWNAIAAISGALGAIGVIATVVYLAFQIKQNTRSIQGATEQTLMSAELELYSLLTEHAGVYRRGTENLEQLDPDERVVFDHLIWAVLSQSYGAFVQYQRNLIPKSVWNAYLSDWPEHLALPGFRQAWLNSQRGYPKEFADAINGAVNIKGDSNQSA